MSLEWDAVELKLELLSVTFLFCISFHLLLTLPHFPIWAWELAFRGIVSFLAGGQGVVIRLELYTHTQPHMSRTALAWSQFLSGRSFCRSLQESGYPALCEACSQGVYLEVRCLHVSFPWPWVGLGWSWPLTGMADLPCPSCPVPFHFAIKRSDICQSSSQVGDDEQSYYCVC